MAFENLTVEITFDADGFKKAIEEAAEEVAELEDSKEHIRQLARERIGEYIEFDTGPYTSDNTPP